MNSLVNKEIVDAIHKMAYCSQDNVPNDQKKVIAHYFVANMVMVNDEIKVKIIAHWFVLENSMYDEPAEHFANGFGKVVFGAADLGYGLELGDFSIDEIEHLNVIVNIDTSFKPLETTMGELRKKFNLEWMV